MDTLNATRLAIITFGYNYVIPVYKNTSEHDIIQGYYTCLFGAYSIPWKSIRKTKLDLRDIEEELRELYNLHKNL